MRSLLSLLVLLALMGATRADPHDPHRWLEDVTGKKALAWVKQHDGVARRALAGAPAFGTLVERMRAALDTDANIPYVQKIGAYYYNFKRDRAHEHGVWRRTTPDEYRKDAPRWETMLDLDELARKDRVAWVWQGASCLRPAFTRCLVHLSLGGSDAIVIRELDLETRAFVPGGFALPPSKGELHWRDRDSVFVETDFGAGTMTTSGYPRMTKLWRRGTPLARAELVFEAKATDIGVSAQHDDTPGFERDFVVHDLTMEKAELALLRGGKLLHFGTPLDGKPQVWREWYFLQLRSDWTVTGPRGPVTYRAGALLVAPFEDVLAHRYAFEVLFEPMERRSLASLVFTRHAVLLQELDEVRDRIEVLHPGDNGWRREVMTTDAPLSVTEISAVDDAESDEYFLTVNDFITPATLFFGTIGGPPPVRLKQDPSAFDASGLVLSQHEARSRDGTRVPYFEVARAGLELDGARPTLLSGYGGFEESMRPSYDSELGLGWLEQGGVYVLANIRGGGEFGPAWHRAAIGANRPRAYEDFGAVAEDLIRRKVTAPAHLGIEGGSNGGLLVGNMLVRRPELWGAVVCSAALLDMRRYSHLLAGASWMEEYGDPDDPEAWRHLEGISPYHQVRADVRYPPVLFTTSTADDRVHPGHTRKMVAKMEAQHHEVLLYENIEGGHDGAATHLQSAFLAALEYTFLWARLR